MMKVKKTGILVVLSGWVTVLSAQTGVITNGMLWTDDNGAMINASMGGHITQVDDTYYWVGNDQNNNANGYDVHLYSSKTLGSGDWKHEGKLVDFNPGEDGHKNCTLLRSPATGKFVIVAKSGLCFYESAQVTGPYTLVRTINKYNLGNHGNYKVGGMGTFQDGTNAYVITSRRYLGSEHNDRYTAIYRLTPDFTDVAEEILWMRNDNREAMWLFKRGDTYYMSASHTAGWTPSHCYYRSAADLSGPWSTEKQIGMDPPSSGRLTRSHGTQHRYIMQVNGQWVYGGDRYPYQESESYSLANGLKIMCPVVWVGDHPVVKWEQTWSVDAEVTPFGLWAHDQFIVSGPNGDADGDTLSNLGEFAFGGDPLDRQDQGWSPRLEKNGEILSYRFPRRKGSDHGLNYSIQYCSNLVSDSWFDSVPVESATEALNDEYEWVLNDLSVQTNQFIRIKVTEE